MNVQPLPSLEGEELLRLQAATDFNRYFEARAQTMPKDVPEWSLDEINDLVHELRSWLPG